MTLPTDNPTNPEPAWFADPMGRHEYRWWDGVTWTDRVASHGKESTDVMDNAPKTVVQQQGPDKVANQVGRHMQQVDKRGAPMPAMSTGGGLFDHPLLVINQKWKLIEVNTEFAIMDPNGTQVGSVRQVGQSTFKKVIRFFGSIDQYFTHKYQIVDAAGVPQLLVTRPRKFIKSRVIIQDPAGNEIGTIVQQNVFGKIRFGFIVGGHEIGGIFAENWRAWNFAIKDANGTEVARITKTFEGLLKTAFTTADNYVLQVHHQLPDPLRLMVYASALTVDTALKQDARGVSGGSLFDIFGG